MSDLDKLMHAWSERPVHADLSQVEPRVWGRIDAPNRTSASGIIGFRAALIASMMAVGVVAGGVASATAEPEPSPFAVHSTYTPSTLLEGGR